MELFQISNHILEEVAKLVAFSKKHHKKGEVPLVSTAAAELAFLPGTLFTVASGTLLA
jgi:hypothetical protein